MTDTNEPSDPVPTADGSFTFWHPDYREHYHSKNGASSESEIKFISPSRLEDRLRHGPVRLLDIGFGLGGNAFAALRRAVACASHPLEIHSLENDPDALERGKVVTRDPEEQRWFQKLEEQGTLHLPQVELTLHAIDFRESAQVFSGQTFDLFFHDPFSPMKNPQGWTLELFDSFRTLAADSACLLTYSEAWAVRAGLQRAGWTVGETPGRGSHRGGTIASPDPGEIACPVAEPEGIKTIPYRDPNLSHSAQEILRTRQEEVNQWQHDHRSS